MLKLETYNLAEAFGWTLLHSLWQGALIAVLLVLVYNLAKPKASEARYAMAVGSLLLIFLSSGITFYVCLEQSKRLQIEINGNNSQSWALEFDNFELFLSEQVGQSSQHKAPWNVALDLITPYTPWLTWVWLMGFIFFSLKWLMGYFYVQNLRFRHSKTLDFEWQSKLNHLARRMGLNQTLLMLESAKIHSPMTIGHLKPVVLVPVGLLTGMNPVQVEAILAHELAHILRNDFLVNLILSFIEGIFFYHPAVWWISERIRQEREHCCDDMAVAITENKKQYAETLALVATHSIHSPKMAMTMQGNKQHLMTRIKRLFQPETYNNRLSGRATFGLIVLMGFSTLAWVSPETAEKIQPKNWAEVHDAPLLFSDWISPEGQISIDVESKPSNEAVAEKIRKELTNRVYTITRLDSPIPFPPMPPLPDFKGMKLPTNMAMPPTPQFPRSMVIQIDEDMSDEEIEELVKAYEDQIEDWQEEYEDAMEEYAEQMEEWGEEFGEKMEKEYSRDMEKWGEEYGKKYGKMWEKWGEQIAEEIEKGAESDNKEQWMKDLERELSKLSDDFEFRFEDNSNKGKDGYKYEYKIKEAKPSKKDGYKYEYRIREDNDSEARELRERIEAIQRQEQAIQRQEQTRKQEERARLLEEQVRRQEEVARRLEEQVRRQEERARRQEEQVRRQEEQARRQEEQARILQERQRVGSESVRESREGSYEERMREYNQQMRGYELGRLEREKGELARDKAMLEREVRALKNTVDRNQDVIFDDEFLQRVERVKEMAEDIEGQIAKEEMMRAMEAQRKQQEEMALKAKIIAEQKRQEAVRAEYEAEMRAIKRELARAEQNKIEMQRQMRAREIERQRIQAEKARIQSEKALIQAEKARIQAEKVRLAAEAEKKAREAQMLRPVESNDNVDEKVTKIAEIAKIMKGDLVEEGYIRPESHVKLSITNGVIMINDRPLRSDDYPKYRNLIRMMGVNLYDGDTVIEF